MSDTDTETITLRYDGPAPRVRVPPFDIDVRSGETVEVPADATVPDGDDGRQPLTEMLSERYGFEEATHYTDVLDQPVTELEADLATGEYDHQLDALAHAEREGQNRKTALEAIRGRAEEA